MWPLTELLWVPASLLMGTWDRLSWHTPLPPAPATATPSLRPHVNQAQRQGVDCVEVFPGPAMRSKGARGHADEWRD